MPGGNRLFERHDLSASPHARVEVAAGPTRPTNPPRDEADQRHRALAAAALGRQDRLGSPRREVWWSRAGLGLTVVASLLFVRSAVATPSGGGRFALAIDLVMLGLVLSLVYGSLAYQVSRLGFHARRAARPEIPPTTTDAPLAVLVPSYCEEPAVVRQTLLSAALLDHVDRRVVLLLDDPPVPRDADDAARLTACRSLPAEVEALLARLGADLQRLRTPDGAASQTELRQHLHQAVRALRRTAQRVETFAAAEPQVTHTDVLFIDTVLGGVRAELLSRSAELRGLAGQERIDATALRAHTRALSARFRCPVTSFERKQFLNCSHEPNKAMNLNSYLGLLGRRFRIEDWPDGRLLLAAGDDPADLEVAPADFVITLDADSIVRPDYARVLLAEMTAAGNERVAIAQTPYSAIPGSPSQLERVAGATTDLQYVIHQGFARYGAAYWVGANALIRVAALADIRQDVRERGHLVPRFIQDRTVIEDTESTIDLARRGWRVHNHPERLSFSATPPDFGSLVIQRRRWANGGLLILPKLLRSIGRRTSPAEVFLRAHYLVSIALTNVALVALLSTGASERLGSWWLPVAALPYFALSARDLQQAGYRRRDVVHVYALNLLLVPVNLGGVAKSVQQAVRAQKIPFGRTPKVADRTAVPPLYLLGALALLGHAIFAAGWDLSVGHWAHAAYSAGTAALLAWAITVFVGWRELAADLDARLPRPRLARRLRIRVAG